MSDSSADVLGTSQWVITADPRELDRALEGIRLGLTATEDKQRRLEEAWKDGRMGADAYYAAVNKLKSKQEELYAREEAIIGQMVSYTAATNAATGATNNAAAATTRLNAGAGNAGRGVLQLAYALDDAQQFSYGLASGMRAVGNNVPGLLIGFGAGPGLAGTLALVGTAAAVATPLIAGMIRSFAADEIRYAADEVDYLRDRIKELKEMGPSRLAVDDHELVEAEKKLDRLTKAKRAFDGLMSKQSEHERASGQAVEKAIVETPGGREALEAGYHAKVKDLQGQLNDSPLAKEIAALDQKIKEQRALVNSGFADEGASRFLDRLVSERAAKGEEFKKKQDTTNVAIASLGEAFEKSIHGVGADQAGGQKQVAVMLRASRAPGAEAVARKIEENSPSKVRTKAEQAEEKRKADEAAREKKQRDDLLERQLDHRATGLANALQKRSTLADLSGHPLDLERELRDAGLSGHDIGLFAPRVRDRLTKARKEAVEKRALERGFSEDEAGADLLREADDKDRADIDRLAKESPAERRRRADIKRATSDASGQRPFIKQQLDEARRFGLDLQATAERLKGQLEERLQHVPADIRAAVAAALVDEESRKAADRFDGGFGQFNLNTHVQVQNPRPAGAGVGLRNAAGGFVDRFAGGRGPVIANPADFNAFVRAQRFGFPFGPQGAFGPAARAGLAALRADRQAAAKARKKAGRKARPPAAPKRPMTDRELGELNARKRKAGLREVDRFGDPVFGPDEQAPANAGEVPIGAGANGAGDAGPRVEANGIGGNGGGGGPALADLSGALRELVEQAKQQTEAAKAAAQTLDSIGGNGVLVRIPT